MEGMDLYTSNKEKFNEIYEKVKIDNCQLNVKEVENGIMLPLRRKKYGHIKESLFDNRILYEGGVCTRSFEFVAGFSRDRLHNNPYLSCKASYIPRESIQKINETVVFGGVLINHFGNLVLESLSRIWYWLENRKNKVAFVLMGSLLIDSVDFEQKFKFYNYLNLLGINEENSYIIVKSTQFEKIIVPDESVYSLEPYANTAWLKTFDCINNNVEGDLGIRKIYLTRRYLKKEDSVNEEFLENFYKKQGYVIIAPETLPLEKQIALLKGAEYIAAILGTLTHLILFSKNIINIDIFIRDSNTIIRPQFLINRIKNVHANFIEITRNILPASHTQGAFFYYPTDYFKKFVEKNNLKIYTKRIDNLISDKIYEFFVKYINCYSGYDQFFLISKFNAYDFLNSLKKCILNKSLSRERCALFDYENSLKKIPRRIENIWKFNTRYPISNIIVYCCYGDKIAWESISDASTVKFHTAPLIAIKICSKYSILYSVSTKNDYIDIQNSQSLKFCGTYDRENPIQSISCSLESSLEGLSIGYRAFFDGYGWTDVKYNGEICCLERKKVFKDFVKIMAVQIFIEKKF